MPNIQFQLRRGDAATWTSTNPTLAAGEFGFETDTRQLKVGNGTSNWIDLSYIQIGQAANWSTFAATQTVNMNANVLSNSLRVLNGAGTAAAPSYTFMADLSMGLYDPSSNVLGFVTSGLQRMQIASNGNVGIGTTDPQLTLDVRGSSRLGTSNSTYANIQGVVNIDTGALGTTLGNTLDHLAIRSTNGNTDQVRFYSSRDLAGGSSWPSAPFFIQRYVDGTANGFGYIKFGGSSNSQGVNLGWGSTDVLSVTSSSRVGIGTSTLSNYKLSIQTTGGSNGFIAFHNSGNNVPYVGFGYDQAADGISFRRNAGGGDLNSDVMFLSRNTGNVGINRMTPEFPLTVYGAGSPASSIPNSRFFDGATGLTTTTIGTSAQFSIYSQFAILAASGFYAASDTRIKTSLQDISDGDALARLRLIEPTSYEYIDKVDRGSDRVYGFIAQQVREVMPYAVSLQSEVIPDIYDLADVSGSDLILRTKTFAYSDISGTLNIILRETGKNDVSANFHPPNVISLHEPLQQDISEVFVYGRKVNDFHVLDKNAIFTTNVAATQELDRQLQAARSEIVTLKDTLSNMMERVVALENRSAI